MDYPDGHRHPDGYRHEPRRAELHPGVSCGQASESAFALKQKRRWYKRLDGTQTKKEARKLPFCSR